MESGTRRRCGGLGMPWLLAVVAASSIFTGDAGAEIRLQSHSIPYICRVVITIDNYRGERVVYDGPVKRGQYKSVRFRDGATICVRRNQVPKNCNSPLTRPQCMVDQHSNRTKLFSIR